MERNVGLPGGGASKAQRNAAGVLVGLLEELVLLANETSTSIDDSWMGARTSGRSCSSPKCPAAAGLEVCTLSTSSSNNSRTSTTACWASSCTSAAELWCMGPSYHADGSSG
eukprot:CAMPEP_0177444630 /NCGR_PEP_ID=MMETSP0369-20130122/6102_1 /TAXON_ID=447022 ORGANISM="Scrippsiella hangoei-like, Strain SHHI-4" /NCGR_SAMPLE_ID=MMETSP0369 /ASSEMBLY_ACC=CAM_ASM_000364 /LENGTH=111 /DNA_ID=CAMNT_0018916699 /DNA_START=1200 /DNA_END=1535 /DNA_ORIENTATION=-